MSSQLIKNVVQIGAAGNLGGPVLSALLAAGKFNVTVLARQSSTSSFPPEVRVVKIDYSSKAALVDVFKGKDVVILTFGGGPTIYPIQNTVVEAAIEAGVPYVVPCSFGIDTINEPGKSAPVFAPKVKSEEYIRKLAEEGKIKHLTVFTGAFLDWALKIGFLVDPVKKKAEVFKDAPKFAATTIPSVADAVVSAISNPERFANKPIRIHDFFVTIPEVVAVLEDELGEKFEVTVLDVDTVAKESAEKLAKGDVSGGYLGLVKVISVGPNSASAWDPSDESEPLGLKKKDLREEVVKVLKDLKLK